MSEGDLSKTGLRWDQSILIGTILLLIFLTLPWIFTLTASSIPDTQINEQVGIVKSATELLSKQIWWYLLPLSVFLFFLAFHLATRTSSARTLEGSDPSTGNVIKGLFHRGFLLLEVYIFFFLIPFSLLRYYDLKRVSMGWIADRSWVAAITLSIIMVVLFLLYYSAYRLTLGQNARRLWMMVLGGAFLFALINFFVFPISSTDLYDYVSRGRISGIHGGNPLVEVPNDYPNDPYVQLAAWRADPSAYGPLWEVVSGLIGRFAGHRLLNDMLAYKGLASISYLLSTLAIAVILRRVTPNRSLAGTLLFAWNPLILLDAIANGHNDMMMVAFILGAFWILNQAPKDIDSRKMDLLHSRKWIYGCLALLFLTLAILIKFIPVLLLPPFIFYLLSQEKGLKRKTIFLTLIFLLLGWVVFVYYRVFWDWPEISTSLLHRTEMFRTSLASLTVRILGMVIQPSWAEGIAAAYFLAAFGLGYLFIILHSALEFGILPAITNRLGNPPRNKWGKFIRTLFPRTSGNPRRENWEILVSTSLKILLLYLLLGSMWFWPWYLIWPLALLALSNDERLVTILIVVACAGQLSYVLWNFVWYWMGIEWETLYVIENLALCLLIVPAIVIFFKFRRQKQWG
jgi:alpha-1,6-mannosyltransferase